MFQPEWAQKYRWCKETQCHSPFKSKLDRDKVKETLLLHWEEHCTECAPPQCYRGCPLYLERIDRKCANFLYGIYGNPNFSGLFDFGADIRFRRWAKIETNIYAKGLSPSEHRLWQDFNCSSAKILNLISNFIQPLSPRRRLNGAFYLCRELLLKHISDGNLQAVHFFDDFVLEAYLPFGETPTKLILEYSVINEIKYRSAFILSEGQNFYTIRVRDLHLPSNPAWGMIRLYPEENAEPRIIFTWLDFVRYKKSSLKKERAVLKPAPKVKCVAWDLDNTLWDGILIEDGRDALKPNPEALTAIKKLDERGILQTIVSKNNFAESWEVIQDWGLKDYFLYPAINWARKSANLEEIAKRLNINVDTFALIDDSLFERSEVQSVLPQVRTYSEEEINAILTREEFDVPITETAKTRRLSYIAEIKRETAKDSYSGDYENFLRSCEMKLDIFIPREKNHIIRCLELLQRSNQLNLSGRRYIKEQFNELLLDKNLVCIALMCQDKFGDYGIIGFISIDETQKISIIKDFVISCRVAGRRVEHTFFKWLALRQEKKGRFLIHAELIQNERNNLLFNVFQDISFQIIGEKEGSFLMELSTEIAKITANVMEVEDNIPC